MRKYWETGIYSQPTAGQLQRNAESTRSKAAQKGKELHPIIVKGRSIAETWWGKAWCMNLERYADYASRIDRGKRYVRSGTVVDLVIKKGIVHAKVQGSRKVPYKVTVRISPLKEEKCQSIIDRCMSKLETVEQLVAGDFPEEMKSLFGGKDGLFPTPREISFECSCPDWALMCKHVAAVLYGIGVRFDEDPLLFFELRGIDFNRFIDISIANAAEQMLDKAGSVSSERIIEESVDITALFGV